MKRNKDVITLRQDNFPKQMKRYFIYLSYDGSKYHGWQIQPNGISVQEVLEKVSPPCSENKHP